MNRYEILTFCAGMFSYACHTLFMHFPKFTKRMHAFCVAISSACGVISSIGIYNGGALATETFWLLSALWGIFQCNKTEKFTTKYKKYINFLLPFVFSLYAFYVIGYQDHGNNWYEISSLCGGVFIYIFYTLFVNYKKFTKRYYSICVCIASIFYIIGAIGIRNRGTILVESFWLCVGIWGIIRNR